MRLVRLIVAMKKKELTKKSTEQLNCSDNLNINGPVNHIVPPEELKSAVVCCGVTDEKRWI